MKNIHSPEPEDFILTNKKIRIIKSLFRNYLEGMVYRYERKPYPNPPEPKEIAKFLKDRAVFLKNIKFIVTVGSQTNNIETKWLSIGFEYKNVIITGYTGLVDKEMAYKTYHYIVKG